MVGQGYSLTLSVFFPLGLEESLADSISQVLCFGQPQMALARVGCQTGILEGSQDLPEVEQVVGHYM